MDKLKIALYGSREDRLKQAEQTAKADKDSQNLQTETQRRHKNIHLSQCATKIPSVTDKFAPRATSSLHDEEAIPDSLQIKRPSRPDAADEPPVQKIENNKITTGPAADDGPDHL